MDNFMNTQQIVRSMNQKILGGAKIPHTSSFPVLRKKDGKYVIALFTLLQTREQREQNKMQRPSYWCVADVQDGDNFVEYNCKENEFCTAPYDRLYNRGIPARAGNEQDIKSLYAQLDEIRMNYVKSGVIDAFSYKRYLDELFKLIPSGQINFYRELSKMV